MTFWARLRAADRCGEPSGGSARKAAAEQGTARVPGDQRVPTDAVEPLMNEDALRWVVWTRFVYLV